MGNQKLLAIEVEPLQSPLCFDITVERTGLDRLENDRDDLVWTVDDANGGGVVMNYDESGVGGEMKRLNDVECSLLG